MKIWRFLQPGAIGFTLMTAGQALADKLKGAPVRPLQAADYVEQHAVQGDPQSVLHTLDRFAREERWLMSVGPEKGPLLHELASRLPSDARLLELGSYCGYSAILMATLFGPRAQITSIEIDERMVQSSRRNIALAGLDHQIRVLHGPSSEVLATLAGVYHLVLLDHWKDLYKRDLMLIEERGLIAPQSIVAADNVGELFAPEEFLNYVRGSGKYDCEHRPASVEYTDIPDAVEICVYLGSGDA
ncbi:MAG: class I SAM-dependent methyltransferase [Pseudomonadota bacterium]